MRQYNGLSLGQISLHAVSHWSGKVWQSLKLRKRKEEKVPQATDVAKYILERTGPMTTMKLQKLVYYCQAWSLVWDERPLFNDEIQAWRNGPVVPALYEQHKGMFRVDASNIQGNAALFDQDGRETIDAVLEYYGERSAQYLSDLTHMEQPWREARKDCEDGDNSNGAITHAMMAEYYTGLEPNSPNG